MSRNIYEAERLQNIQEAYFKNFKKIVDGIDKMISGMKKDKYPTNYVKEIEKARDILLKLLTMMA